MAFTASACAQPRLERLAREIGRSVPRSGSSAVKGRITLRLMAVEQKGGVGAISAAGAGGPQLPAVPIAFADFVAQPGRRAALFGPTGEPASVTQDRVLYAKRKLNGPADTRPWVRLEVERLDDIDVPNLDALMTQQNMGLLAILSPELALDLLRGVLTGSIEQQRASDGTRRLGFNVSIAKAERELKTNEDERDDRKRLLHAIGVTGDIFPGRATLRPDGTLSALRLTFAEKPNKRTAVKLRLELTMANNAAPAFGVKRPTRDATIRVSSLAALRGNLIDDLTVGLTKDPTELPGQLATLFPTTTTTAAK